MNFKNRLEALKWMCENVGKKIYFDFDPKFIDACSGHPVDLCITNENLFSGSIGAFVKGSINFRTTPEYILDPKPESEFKWPITFGVDWDRSYATKKELYEIYDALIKFLDKRFVRK